MRKHYYCNHGKHLHERINLGKNPSRHFFLTHVHCIMQSLVPRNFEQALPNAGHSWPILEHALPCFTVYCPVLGNRKRMGEERKSAAGSKWNNKQQSTS